MRNLMITAIALLLLTNVVVLAGIAYNRSGEPLASVLLTERELSLPVYYAHNFDEDSSTSLHLEWSLLDSDDDPEFLYTRYVTPGWLNHAKLIELGIDLEKLKKDDNSYTYTYNDAAHTADVILVLEYNGETYQTALTQTEHKVVQLQKKISNKQDKGDYSDDLDRYKNQLDQLKTTHSRLYVIDAGLNQNILAQKYADKNKYLLARGEIGVDWQDKKIVGHIRHLYISDIHVPLPYSRRITDLTQDKKNNSNSIPVSPRYAVQLNIGQRMEPWIEAVKILKEGK
ncbi:MAG: DUF4824 family protein [Gammaproteobacteria bacterium]|nr:DUF4824 family protein [Gammaproteobacteria bacterium]